MATQYPILTERDAMRHVATLDDFARTGIMEDASNAKQQIAEQRLGLDTAKYNLDAGIAGEKSSQWRQEFQQKMSDTEYQRARDKQRDEQGAPLTKAQVSKMQEEARRLKMDNDMAERGLGNYRPSKQMPPEQVSDIVNRLNEFIDFGDKGWDGLNDRLKETSIDMAASGKPAKDIASRLALPMRGGSKSFFGPDKPAPNGDWMWPGARQWAAQPAQDKGAVESGMPAKPAQQPQESPELQEAKRVIGVFLQRRAENPEFPNTLTVPALNRLNAAFDLVESQQPPPMPEQETPPGIMPNGKPRGQILPDAALADLNGDGKKDEADQAIQARYQGQLDRVSRADAMLKADPTIANRMTPAAKAQLDKARQEVRVFQAHYRKQLENGIAGMTSK